MFANKKIKISILVLTSLLLTSCANKTKHGDFNNDFKQFTNKNFKKTETRDYVKDSIVEVINKNDTLTVDNVKKLSTLLNELANIDKNSYMLSKSSEDIFIEAINNSHKLNINTFEKLNQYIKDTSNNFIYISKNRFLKDRVKIVAVKNQSIYESDLKEIPFTVNGRVAIADVLEELKDISGFNVIAKNVGSSEDDKKLEKVANERLFSNNSIDGLFENTYISFSGNNIMELLNYISISFNVFVDVDYDNKNIIFNKVKSKIFSVNLNDVSYSGSLDVKKTISNDVGSGDDGTKSITTKIKLDILESLEKSLQALIDSSSEKNKILSFNRTVGSIFVKADKKTMKEMESVISNFNNIFEKQIDFKLEIYEFAVTKEFNAGISLGAIIDTNNIAGTLISSTVSNPLFTSNVAVDAKRTSGAYLKGAKLNNNIVKLLKQTRHGYILKNSIPYYIDVSDSKSYIKSVTTTTTTVDGASVTTSEPEPSEINEGTVLSVLGRVYNNKIEFNIQPKIVRINGIKTATYNGNTISLPDLSVNTFTSNIILKDGEKKIIGYLTTYDDVKDYSGIAPLENFILGGEQSNKRFRKETVFVVSANIRN